MWLCQRRHRRAHAGFDWLDWISVILPCVAWLRRYRWRENLKVRSPTVFVLTFQGDWLGNSELQCCFHAILEELHVVLACCLYILDLYDDHDRTLRPLDSR